MPGVGLGGRAARLATLAKVLRPLMPWVGEVPDAEWATAKLYAPHVAAVLAQLQVSGAEPSEAVASLLGRSARYAANVLCDFQQALQ